MITKIRHTGIVVRNLDNALSFYEGLGFKTSIRQVEEGPFIEQVVNIKDVKVETAKLLSPCGGMLELLQYHSHPQIKAISKQDANQLGCSHIAVTVDSIECALEQVIQLGGALTNPPKASPNGKCKVAYCHDREGVLLEIVEELK
jgi:catechol 2,3-dioxygenase-like lactoylglutathione lyase family enzyme